MKKILILSYFYHPCSLTASNRVSGFAKHLNKFGIFPVIITRNWDLPINTPEDVLKSTGSSVKHEIFDSHEVYYLPYKSSLRDRIFLNSKNSTLKKYTSKILTILTMVLELVSNRFIPFANLLYFTLDYLQKNKDIEFILTSANPFIQFKFCYQIHKKTGIPWIADYRDAWTTNKMVANIRSMNKPLNILHRFFEKKWCKTAVFFTSVSDSYVDSIKKLIKINGYKILNGYEVKYNTTEFSTYKHFQIVYNGTLYYNQDVETFLKAVKTFNLKNDNSKIHIHFAGLGFDVKQTQRVKNEMVGFEKYLNISTWLSKDEIIEIQKNADLLLMLTYSGFKGIPSSKLYEYIGLQKNILVYPNDYDIIQEIVLNTKLGLICNSDKEILENITELITRKELKIKKEEINSKNIDLYSRERQTEILAKLINQVIY
jgi:glycosyltransferase involved in cell wall biosynthesis